MEIHSVSHIAIGVRDMEKALAFYRDVLGMRVTLDTPEEFPGIGGAEPLRRRGVYLRWGEGPHASFVVLDEQLSTPPFGEPAKLFQVGVHHVSFWVDDVDAYLERAREAGFEVVVPAANGDTLAYGEATGGVVRTAFLSDADGNYVQLDQRAGN